MKIKINIFGLIVLFFLSLTNGVRGDSGWKIKTSMPTPRYGVTSAKVGNDIYIIGGIKYDDEDDEEEVSDVVEKYNPITNSWDTDIDHLKEERYNATAVTFEGQIYVIGGSKKESMVREVEIYDPATNKWRKAKQHMPHYREGGTVVVYDEKIYLIGGIDSNSRYTDKVEVFDPKSEMWEELPQTLHFPRAFLAAVTLNDTIFALGGFYYSPLKAVEKLFPGSNGWQTISDMSTSRASFAACTINDVIYVMGGRGQSKILQSTESYDPAAAEWSIEESMIHPRESFTAQVVNDKIYVFGGTNNNQLVLSQVEEFTPTPSSVEIYDTAMPAEFILYQNYPNPFNSQTVIRYSLTDRFANHVTLTIYNVFGQQIVKLVDEYQQPGFYQIIWQGKDAYGNELPSGAYFGQLRAGSLVQKIKLILAK